MNEYPTQTFPESHWKRYATEPISGSSRRPAPVELLPIAALASRTALPAAEEFEPIKQPVMLPVQN